MKIRLSAYKRNKRRMEFILSPPSSDVKCSETVIGRSADCDLRVNDSRVSRRHCRLVLSGQMLTVTDLGSRHGTYVNGRRVQHARLTEGDRLSMGRLFFQVRFEPGLDEALVLPGEGDHQQPAEGLQTPGEKGTFPAAGATGETLSPSAERDPDGTNAHAASEREGSVNMEVTMEVLGDHGDASADGGSAHEERADLRDPLGLGRKLPERGGSRRGGSGGRRHGRSGNSAGPPRDEPAEALEPRGAIARREPLSGALPTVVLGEGGMLSPAGARAPAKQHPPFKRILRYKWMILLVTVLIAAPAIGGIWKLVRPQYKATGIIRVRPYIPRLVFQTEDNSRGRFYKSYMATQVGVLRSPTILQPALDRPEVRGTAWYDQQEPFWQRSSRSRLERLQEELLVSWRGETELIDVSIQTLKPKDAAILVNAVLDEYERHVGQATNEDSSLIFRELESQYNTLNGELEGLGKTVADLRKELGTGDPAELVAQKRLRLDTAQAELDKLRRSLAVARFRQQDLQSRLGPSEPATQPAEQAAANARYQDDAEWRRLYMDLRSAQHAVQLEQAQGQLGEQHPTMIALKKRVEFAGELLRAREAQLDNSPAVPTSESGPLTLAQQLDGTTREIELLKYELQLLTEDLDKEKQTWEQTFDKAQVLSKELTNIHRKEQIFEAVRTRLEERRMESNAPGAIEVLSRAVRPSKPFQDRRMVLTAAAVFIGLAVGVGLAFLRAGADPAIHQAEELAASAAVPFLGQLPQVHTKRNRPPLDDRLLNEGIRMVRTPLLQRMGKRHGSMVLITSAGMGEGKTTTAVMLARSLAQCGKKVLLVDADLRNPSVSRHLGISSKVGLVECLAGQAEDSEAIIQTDTPRLSVLAGLRSEQGIDPELIANGAFSAAIARWRKKYEVVLLDSSPVLPVADARILAHHADGTILVVWAERTRRDDVVEALTHLESAGGKLWGTVFVGSRRRDYGYSYDYGYGTRR